MRRAYEIAFADASAFLKSRCPNLLSMDEVTFRRPVHVGSLLKLTSHIVYAEGYPHRSFQVCWYVNIFFGNTASFTDIDIGASSG
jgi:acyl-coenzyme A thioesterase 9